uniref:BRCA1-associated RING domain protein 1 n=1 Tax=Ciona savignyi TaxID=51511 RepID=H2YAG8_CIOSA
FPQTVKALEKLEDLMKCNKCSTRMDKPVTLWNCDHVFCKQCLKDCSICPVCKIPSWANDQRENKPLQMISSICAELQSTITKQQTTDCLDKQIKTSDTLQNPNVLRNKATPQRKSLNLDELRLLLKEGLDVNAKDHAGWTALHEACNRGFTDVVEVLVTAGAYINIPGYENETPLMDAVANNRFETVKFLLKSCADINLRSLKGQTAVTIASSDEMKQLLLTLHCDGNTDVSLSSLSQTSFFPIVIAGSSSISQDLLVSAAKVLNAEIANDGNATTKTTHFIVKCDKSNRTNRTLKYLQSVAAGAWVLNELWLDACVKRKHHVNEENFVVEGCKEDAVLDGPLRSVDGRLKSLPRLFDGCHFFLSGRFSPPGLSKNQLCDIIKLAGGELLSREPKPDSDRVQACTKIAYHARPICMHYLHTYYIVYDASQNSSQRIIMQGKVATVTANWILDCISQFSILSS